MSPVVGLREYNRKIEQLQTTITDTCGSQSVQTPVTVFGYICLTQIYALEE